MDQSPILVKPTPYNCV